MAIESVLVANRGEVAVRIVRACRALGLRSIAVYSDADVDALHVRAADAAVRLGPAPARSSYLDVDALLAAAAAQDADAVHPGYGLLSEDAGFAAAVADKGLTFVGPDPEVIAAMGDKVAARAVARRCGVPVLDGTEGPVDAADPSLVARAEAIGFPVLVKAAHGGGGRGMRVVRGPADLAEALAGAQREAVAAFGRGEVFLERYLERPRHVEVQVLADGHGTVVHLGDRDCSVQRRHQKLLEEAPAPNLPDGLRQALRDAAVRLAREVGYRGAGTVEFLVDSATAQTAGDPAPGAFAFLEMNTRLQVEHGVTELVTGVDVVAAQLSIAAGTPLDLAQHDMVVRGHAIQARIAAEDPWEGFRPAPGALSSLRLPSGPWVRTDFGYEQGDVVPGMYDSLLGKVHAWGPDRDAARARLGLALDDLAVVGVPSTAPYLREVLDEPAFVAGCHDTGSLERAWAPDPARRPPPPTAPTAPTAPTVAGEPVRRVQIATDRGPLMLSIPGRRGATGTGAPSRRAARADHAAAPAGPARGTDDPVAPMDATVVSVRVAVGDQVTPGDVLVVLEAMKMELPVRAARPGRVAEVRVGAGEAITAGQELVVLAD